MPSTVVYTYDGVCGSANGVSSVNAPANDLCHVGVALNTPTQDASGNWDWTCYGGNGPKSHNASCSAVGSVNGQCNSATTSTPSATAPTGELCSAGTATAVSGGAPVRVDGTAPPWTWSCVGTGSGTTASCSEPFATTPTDGQCDPAMSGVATPAAPSGNLCSAGTTSAISGGQNGTPWSWTCAGINGGKTAYCAAPNSGTTVDGACDTTTESIATNTAPTGNLCTAGTVSSLSGGSGSAWTWSCDGTGGGANASCSALWVGASCNFTALGNTTDYPNGATWTYSVVKSHSSSGRTCHYNVISHYVCKNGVNTLTSQSNSQETCCCSCFPPDTPVLTADRGWQPISHIMAGDQVVSFDAKDHKTIAIVQRLQITPDRKLRRINGVNISTLQKVQLATGKYVRVEKLQYGDVLVDSDGNPHPIKTLEDVPGMVTVYNLVMKNHDIPFFAAGVKVKDWE